MSKPIEANRLGKTMQKFWCHNKPYSRNRMRLAGWAEQSKNPTIVIGCVIETG